jgi:hypothetical protein
MASERRGNQRFPVNFDAVLSYRNHVIICAVKDLSVNGAFVELPPEDMPHSNADVELGFTITNKGEAHHCRVPARIRRVSESGAGVAFADVAMEDYLRLVEAVYHA